MNQTITSLNRPFGRHRPKKGGGLPWWRIHFLGRGLTNHRHLCRPSRWGSEGMASDRSRNILWRCLISRSRIAAKSQSRANLVWFERKGSSRGMCLYRLALWTQNSARHGVSSIGFEHPRLKTWTEHHSVPHFEIWNSLDLPFWWGHQLATKNLGEGSHLLP